MSLGFEAYSIVRASYFRACKLWFGFSWWRSRRTRTLLSDFPFRPGFQSLSPRKLNIFEFLNLFFWGGGGVVFPIFNFPFLFLVNFANLLWPHQVIWRANLPLKAFASLLGGSFIKACRRPPLILASRRSPTLILDILCFCMKNWAQLLILRDVYHILSLSTTTPMITRLWRIIGLSNIFNCRNCWVLDDWGRRLVRSFITRWWIKSKSSLFNIS